MVCLCGIMSFIMLLVKGYVWSWIISIAIFTTFAILQAVAKRNSRFEYNMKFSMLYFGIIMVVGLMAPVYIFQPRNCVNIRYTGWLIRKFSYITGFTYEVRGADYARQNEAAFVVLNHQSSLDMLTTFNVVSVFERLTAISKKELLYVFPWGPGAWLAGIMFLDRRSKSSFDVLAKCAAYLKRTKSKCLVFAEGTRNQGIGLLPFKKGAFVTAIKNQLPIMPCVYSRYYYIDWKAKTFDKGHHIISVMKPIPTVGLTLDDLDDLLKRTHDTVLTEYMKIEKEIAENKAKWAKENRPRLTCSNSKKDN